MKKSDLKTGMLVELRDNDGENIHLVINSRLVGVSSYDNVQDYNNNLTHPAFNDLDIIKVSKVLEGSDLHCDKWTKETLENNLLWSRQDEPKKQKKIEKKAKKIKKAILLLSNALSDLDLNDEYASIQIFDNAEFNVLNNRDDILIGDKSLDEISIEIAKKCTH